MTGMSSRPSTRRPLGVTLVVVLTAVTAAVDVAWGVLALTGAARNLSIEGVRADQSADVARLLGAILLALGVLHAALAVALARGVNAARLVLTLALLASQAHAFVLVTGLEGRRVEGHPLGQPGRLGAAVPGDHQPATGT